MNARATGDKTSALGPPGSMLHERSSVDFEGPEAFCRAPLTVSVPVCNKLSYDTPHQVARSFLAQFKEFFILLASTQRSLTRCPICLLRFRRFLSTVPCPTTAAGNRGLPCLLLPCLSTVCVLGDLCCRALPRATRYIPLSQV